MKSPGAYSAVVKKILAAFVLAIIAIGLAVGLARIAFDELGLTVERLSSPNEKLVLLNSLFETITTLDQQQRAEALRNPQQPYDSFLDQSVSINAMIDSIATHEWDSTQLMRLDEMKVVLEQRNVQFFAYLKVKARLLRNKTFSSQLDTLTDIIRNDQLVYDSSFFKGSKRTTTTYLNDTTVAKTENRPFLKRIFGKKKKETPAADTPKIKIEEELQVMVDTAAVKQQQAAIKEIESIMKAMEVDQRQQRKKLQEQELEFIQANGQFITRLLNILHQVENEEYARLQHDNRHAVTIMRQSLNRFHSLLIVFFLAAAILVYLIWLDVTRSNYYKLQLEKARDQAEELSQVKQRFLSNMSHEIRTPLQSIIGFAEQLKRRPGVSSEEINAIYSSSEHLLHIVNEVLDFSRISSGKFTLVEEPFRLHHLLREVESSMRVQANRKSLTFLLDLEKSENHWVSADAFRIRQILYNLLGNAIKFTAEGFVKLTLKTEEVDDRVRCTLEIRDSGIGISVENQGKIFQQFEQGDSAITKQFGGTGLGLAIVKSLVEAMNGTIDISSTAGKGTAFTVQFTLNKSQPNEHISNIIPAATQPAKVGTILLVDDDPLILRLCSLILAKNNLNYVTSNNPVALIQQLPPDNITHVLLDIRMPGINGIELCEKLRTRYPEGTKFIALTAHVLPEERHSLLQLGFDYVLAKPFHEDDLMTLLRSSGAPQTKKDRSANLDRLRQMTMGDEALFQSILQQFIEETLQDRNAVHQNINTGQLNAIRESIHKMAGRFAQLGAAPIASQLQGIEKRIVKGESLAELKADIVETLHEVNEVLAQIQLEATTENKA